MQSIRPKSSLCIPMLYSTTNWQWLQKFPSFGKHPFNLSRSFVRMNKFCVFPKLVCRPGLSCVQFELPARIQLGKLFYNSLLNPGIFNLSVSREHPHSFEKRPTSMYDKHTIIESTLKRFRECLHVSAVFTERRSISPVVAYFPEVFEQRAVWMRYKEEQRE